ncbi:tyrosine-type recombinase/integrase [Botrimarina mediterranea]|uniref:Site-specific tyrosine recombinase XerC n=1 Tax=Botrimarina mediterranea TaxID=2528022 RepID=A0A518K9T8_9BACT|nr:tyrosine-type recombinase/integrase [Botrimarina mediterranea]QDV74558.1 site-specific tyrosine recombinase XerC [Botrimarina mediterranea]QDV79198.1 site-specific tyrosine recombinase XerC [Planctomycetes bacterium K2D]
MPKKPKPWLRKGRGWWVTIEGKQYALGTDKDDAYAEFHRLMTQPKERRQVSGKLFAGTADDFLDFVAKNNAEATFAFYRDLLQKFCSLHPNLRIDQLRPFHVQKWVDGYGHLSKNSRRNHMRAVKRCVRWAKKMGYIDTNPIEDLELPGAESREVCLTDAEYIELLRFASPDSLKDLITVTWETGCRPQESLIVRASHVDLENQRWIIPASETKGERCARVVYLTDEALFITRKLMLSHPVGNLFCNSSGRPWTADTVNCAFDRIRQRMGKAVMAERGVTVPDDEVEAFVQTLKKTKMEKGVLREKRPAELRTEARQKLTKRLAATLVPRYSLYALRHTWATNALQRGVNSVTVAELMGHSDPSTLAKTYQHVSKNPKFMLAEAKRATARA